MKNKWRTILKILLVLLLIGGMVCLIIRQVEYYLGDQSYDEARRIAALLEKVQNADSSSDETDPYVELLQDIDLEALRETNEDVIGWLCIPETDISYPLVQGTDNDYYLKHTWDKKSNSVGSVYMEYQNAADFSDFNTIIYGHNMYDDSMFGGLSKYKNTKYWKEHPSIYVVNDDGVHRYDIFAAYKADVDSIAYGMVIETTRRKTEFIRLSLEESVLDTGIYPTTEDKILTISTCSGSGYGTRWIVQGVLGQEASAWAAN